MQPERAHQHTGPNTPARIGGLTAKTQTDAHTPRTSARIGGVEWKRAHHHTHPNTAARNGGAQPTVRKSSFFYLDAFWNYSFSNSVLF